MGEKSRGVEGDFYMKHILPYMGLRPWKRHSTILMVAGILYALIGFQYIIAPPSKTRETSLAVLLSVAPIQVWGAVFVLAGVMASISSRWPPFAETWGYMVLTGLSAGWSAAYFLGVFFFHAPASSISGAIVWGLLAFMWWAISGLVNPGAAVVDDDRQ